MPQPRICSIFGKSCKHKDILLQIPLAIRQRIYTYAGVHSGASISDPYDSDFGVYDQRDDSLDDFAVTQELLHTCTQIKEEVFAFMFAHNTIRFDRFCIKESLRFLSRAPPAVVSSIRNLYIILIEGKDYTRQYPHLGWHIIKSWQLAIERIMSHVPPRLLRLHLVCDTVDVKKAKAVLAPLRERPSHLLELEMRFDGRNDCYFSTDWQRDDARKEIRAMVTETARVAQWRDEPKNVPGFRFLDLPTELRQMVYSYTDLVTPFRKVRARSGAPWSADCINCDCDGDVCRDEDLHANLKTMRCGVDANIPGTTLEFCKRFSPAYSPDCKCTPASSPLALLKTCRTIRQEGLAFLYAYNTVIILPERGVAKAVFADSEGFAPTIMRDGYYGDLVEASREDQPIAAKQDALHSFIVKQRPEISFLLRNIEIVLPRIDATSDISDDNRAFVEWKHVLMFLASWHRDRNGINADPHLSLMLHIWTSEAASSGDTEPLPEMPREDFLEKAARLLEPLKRRRHLLRRLFIFLDWPTHWSPPKLRNDIAACTIPKKPSPGGDIGLHRIMEADPELTEAEAQLEKMVMGEEYDAYQVGKGEQIPSPWVRKQWNKEL